MLLPLLFFMICLGLMLYVYVGYPAALWLLTTFGRKRPIPVGVSDLPTVSLIIAAHNEAEVIGQKLENTLAQTYPEDRLEIIVASDASDDGTDEIVRAYEDRGVRLFRAPIRQGKTGTITSAAVTTTGEILMFSDANALYAPDAIEKMTHPFSDATIGGVSGRLNYENTRRTAMSEGEQLYWSYENQIKVWESAFNSLIGANGSLYALRREAFVPIDSDVSDDFGLPLAAYGRGYRVIFQPLAVSREEAPETIALEFRKKRRFVAHQLTTLARLWPTLRPFRDGKLLFQLVSHKLLRNSVPFFLLGMFVSSLAIPSFGWLLIVLQLAFYDLALIGLGFYRLGSPVRLFATPLYFCTVNLAAAFGVLDFLTRRNYATWNERQVR